MSRAAALRWTTAAMLVAGAHAGAVWIGLNWTVPQAAPGLPEAAILIDLEPPSQTVQEETPPGPEMEQAEAQPDPAPEPEAPAPEQPALAEPPLEIPAPAMAEAILPPPPKPVEKKIEKPRREIKERKPKPPQKTAPPALRAAQETRAAPSTGVPVVSAAARASWQSLVAAHLNRFKRPASTGASGTARVAFRIGAGGQVLSVSLAGTSGDAALDQEALALVRRASPVPAPPPEMGGGIAMVVPVRFTR
jgi:protein TonB